MKKPEQSVRTALSSSVAAVTFVAVLGGASSALAQANDSASPSDDEIVVTATRRSETLQSVPVAVSAFSGDQIENLHAVTLTDLGRLAPGARLEGNGTFPASANFFMRGIGVNTTNPSDDPTVGIFEDGMYLGVNVGALTSMFDLESVEILRGPQGTLFGRNVTGGAVLVRSRRPTGEFGVRGSATVGSYDQRDFNVAIEGPLVDGVLNGKVAFMSAEHDGYFSNAALPDHRIAASDSSIVRPMLQWTPSENWTVTLIGESGEFNDFGTPTKLLIDKGNRAPPVPPGDFDLTSNFPTHSETSWDHLILESVADVGRGTLTTTLSYRELSIDNEAEIDGTAATLFHFERPTGLRQHQSTAEVLYATSLSPALDMTVGANYFQQTFAYQEARVLLSTSRSAGRGEVDHSSAGAFAQVDWEFAPSWTATVGGRYTSEEKTAMVANFGQCDLQFLACNYGFRDSQSWNDFSPKLGLRWEPAGDLMLYGSFTRGFRSGGYNVRNSTGPAGPYEPENVDAYEVGVKSRWFDRALVANVAFYRNEFSDLQRQTLDDQARQRTLNAADAVIQGAELELELRPTDALTLGATAAYTDAHYVEFSRLDLTGDGVPDPERARQLNFARAPMWTYSLSAAYEAPLGDLGSVAFRGSYDYTGRRAANDTNTFTLDSYALVNASIDFEAADGRFGASLFGRNLTNELYTSTGVDISIFRSVYIGPPQTWGLELTYNY